MIALVTRRKVPPGGFKWRCSICGYNLPNTKQPFGDRVILIRKHERNNHNTHPARSKDEVADDLDARTAARFNADGRWAIDITEQMKQAHEQSKNKANCPGCGRRKKVK